MKEFFNRPLFSSDKSLTLVGFFWVIVTAMAAFFAPLLLIP